MLKVVVTGGAGFIGSHLVDGLVKTGNVAVWSLDDYSSGSPRNHNPEATYIRGKTADIERLIDFRPDIVFHLGEYSRVESSFDRFLEVHSSNISSTPLVLSFCKNRGSKLVYAGSSTKFAEPMCDVPGHQQSPYAFSKAQNTELVKCFGDWYGLRYTIVYFYNSYGPREVEEGGYATLVGIYKNRMRNNKTLRVVSPGIQRRNFTHVSDIVSGLILAGLNAEGDGYGIGHHESFSILEVAQMFGGDLEHIEGRSGNRMSAELNTNKILSLGWKPKYSLSEYIQGIKKNDWRDSES